MDRKKLEQELQLTRALVSQLETLLKEAIELLAYAGQMNNSFIKRAMLRLNWKPGERPPYVPDGGRYSMMVSRSSNHPLNAIGTPTPEGIEDAPANRTEIRRDKGTPDRSE